MLQLQRLQRLQLQQLQPPRQQQRKSPWLPPRPALQR